MLAKRPFPNTFGIFAGERYLFGLATRAEPSRVVARGQLVDGTKVLATNLGLIGFDFGGTKLGDFVLEEFKGNGQEPESATESREALVQLQLDRLKIATFVSALICGTHAFKTHSGLADPLFPSLIDIIGWIEKNGTVFFPSSETERIGRVWQRPSPLGAGPTVIGLDSFQDGIGLANRLLAALPDYVAANPVSLIVTAYQAAVLHHKQHSSASVALVSVVLEAALEEMMFAYGLVTDAKVRVALPPSATSRTVSRSRLRDMGFNGMVKHLEDVGLLNHFAVTRIHDVRKSRNNLMHEIKDANPNESGNALTIMRDVLWLCLNERSFVLNAAWAYRM